MSAYSGRLLAITGLVLSAGSTACAEALEPGGKLLLTRGVSNVEGAGGGGVVNWALITGNETDRGVGGTVFGTYLALPDYDLTVYGGAVGLFDRAEISYARQDFDTGDTGAALGIGQGFTFGQDIIGAKLRVAGDAVYDQDSWMPQVTIGGYYKRSDQEALVQALGSEDGEGVEAYVAATKLVLEHSLLLGGALRYSSANQNGLLGFSGDSEAELLPEFSAAYLVSRRLAIGAEYRVKPDNLAFAQEDDWYDIFAAYALNENLTLTAAYADLGSIATFDDQRGLYISLQAGF